MSVDPTSVRDVVVVVPGIMGSELVDENGRLVWGVRAGALSKAILSFGRSLKALSLPEGVGDEHPNDGIRPGGMLGSLHAIPGLWTPVVGYDGLVNFLDSDRFNLLRARTTGERGFIPNLIEFPYDWRLSNRYNGRRLAAVATEALEQWRQQPGMEEARLILLCHSMGGLVARWFAEQEGGADIIRAIVTIGTPHRGALNALDTLVNGLKPGVWRFRLDLSNFVRSLPSLYQLLPTYDCLVTPQGRRSLVDAGAPELDTAMLSDARDFHDALDGGRPSYALHKVVGIRQPTLTTAEIVAGVARVSQEIEGKNQGGDGTVPRLAAEPSSQRGSEVHEVAGQHGSLQGTRALLDLVDGLISRQEIVWQSSADDPFGIDMATIHALGAKLSARVTELNDRRLTAVVVDDCGSELQRTLVRPDGSVELEPLAEGGYQLIVRAKQRGLSVAMPFIVVDGDAGDD